MSDIEELDRSLAEVLDALLALAPGSFAERHALLKRRDELRSQAARFRVEDFATLSPAELLAAYWAIRSSLQRVPIDDPLKPASDRACEIPSLARSRTDRSALTEKLRRVEAQLRERGINPELRRRVFA